MAKTAVKPTYSFKDAATWLNILSIIGAVIAVVHPGFSVQAFVGPASVLAAGIVTAVVAFAKHQVGFLTTLEKLAAAAEAFVGQGGDAPAKGRKSGR